MDTTTLAWPASYKGVGIAILRQEDGLYQGVTQHGFITQTGEDYHAVLADIKTHIDAQEEE